MMYYLIKIWSDDYGVCSFDDNYTNEKIITLIKSWATSVISDSDEYEATITKIDVSDDYVKWFEFAKKHLEDYDYQKHNTMRIIKVD